MWEFPKPGFDRWPMHKQLEWLACKANAQRLAGGLTTCFASWDALEDFVACVPRIDRRFCELITRVCRPYADLDLGRDETSPSPTEVLETIIPELIDFMAEHYGIKLHTTDFIVMEGTKPHKISFHIIIMGHYLDCSAARKDFKERLFSARGPAHKEWLDPQPYGVTQMFRILGSEKPYKDNHFCPVDACGDMPFANVSGMRLRETFAAYVVEGHDAILRPLVAPLTPSLGRAHRAGQRRGTGGGPTRRSVEASDMPRDAPAVEAAVRAALAASGDDMAAHHRLDAWIMEGAEEWSMRWRPAPGERACAHGGCSHDGGSCFIVHMDAHSPRQLAYLCFGGKGACQKRGFKLIGHAPAAPHRWASEAHAVVDAIMSPEGRPSIPDIVLPPGKSTLLKHAPTGTGKTTKAARDVAAIIAAAPSTSVLVIAPLVNLVKSHYQKHFTAGAGFTCYLDAANHDIMADRVVVCINSLLRVQRRKFDVVVVDEPNYMLRALAKMNPAQRPCEVYNLLCHHLRESGGNNIMDAYALTGLPEMLLRHAGIMATTHVVEVRRPPRERLRVEFLFSDGAQAGVNALFLDLAAGKNVAAYCSTKTEASLYHEMTKETFPARTAALLTGDTEDAERNRLLSLLERPPGEGSSLPNAFFFTNALAVGTSIEARHFHKVYAFVGLHGKKDTETIRQALARVRWLIHEEAGSEEASIVVCFAPEVYDHECGKPKWDWRRLRDEGEKAKAFADEAACKRRFPSKQEAVRELSKSPDTLGAQSYVVDVVRSVFRVRRRSARWKRMERTGAAPAGAPTLRRDSLSAALRELDSAPRSKFPLNEYYVETGGVYIARRKSAPRVYSESEAEAMVRMGVALNVALATKWPGQVPGEAGGGNFLEWQDEAALEERLRRTGDPAASALFENGKNYMDLCVAVGLEEMNFPATVVSDLKCFFELEGATVTKKFVSSSSSLEEEDDEDGEGNDPAEAEDTGDRAPANAPNVRNADRDHKLKKKRAFLEIEPLTLSEEETLYRLQKRTKLNNTQTEQLEKMFLNHSFGIHPAYRRRPRPSQEGDGNSTPTYALTEANVTRLRNKQCQEQFRTLCALCPEEEEEEEDAPQCAVTVREHIGRMFKSSACMETQGPWASERLLDKEWLKNNKAARTLLGIDLLRSIGAEPSRLTVEGLRAVSYQGMPKFSSDTMKLLKIWEGRTLVEGDDDMFHPPDPSDTKMVFEHTKLLRKAIKGTLGLLLCNKEVGKSFQNDRMDNNITALCFDPVLPTPRRGIHEDWCSWYSNLVEQRQQ